MSSGPSFGMRCAQIAREEQQRAGKMTWERFAEIIDQQLTMLSLEDRPTVTKKQIQTALWEALVTACGLVGDQMTRPAQRTAAVALAEIRQVSPDVTPEEIARRATAYRRKYSTITPKALCAHWGEFGHGELTTSARRDIYQEPIGWKEIIRERGLPGLSDDALDSLTSRPWEDIRIGYGAQILARIQ